jgi:hypothetical protein
VQGTLFFRANDEVHGYELGKIAPTAALATVSSTSTPALAPQNIRIQEPSNVTPAAADHVFARPTTWLQYDAPSDLSINAPRARSKTLVPQSDHVDAAL